MAGAVLAGVGRIPAIWRALLLAVGLGAAVVASSALLPEVTIAPTRIPIPADEAIVNGGEGPATRMVSWSAAPAGAVLAFDSRHASPLGGVAWLIDPADGGVLGQLTVGATPQAVQSPDGSLLYLVARTIGSDGVSVQMASAVDLSTGEVRWEREIAWPGRTTALTPNSIAVSGDGSLVYVSAESDHLGQGLEPRVSIIDARTGRRERSMSAPGECGDEPIRLFNGLAPTTNTIVGVCQQLSTAFEIEPEGADAYRAMRLDLPAPRPRPYEMVFDAESGVLHQFTSDGDLAEIDLRAETYRRHVDLVVGTRFIESLSRRPATRFAAGRRLAVPVDSASHCSPGPSTGSSDQETACLLVVHDLDTGRSIPVEVDRVVSGVAPDVVGGGFFLVDGRTDRIARFDADGEPSESAITIGTSIASLLALR